MTTTAAASPARPDLTVIIVSYNTREMTLAAVRSLLAGTREVSCEVIVVDNASADGSAQALLDLPPQVRLIALTENIGFARANNLAAEIAKGELLLLLNPDTLVLDGAVDRLVAFARARPDAGIWGGRTLFADGALNPSSVWHRMTLWSTFCHAAGLNAMFRGSPLFDTEAYGGWWRDSEREVDIISGCFFVIRRSLWQRLAGFDSAFFMYGEEADLCLRAARLGARPSFTPAATIVHYGGASEATRAGKMIKLLQAKATLIRRHWPRGSRGAGLVLLAGWPLSRWLAFGAIAALRRSQPWRARAAAWGEVWAARAHWFAGYAGCAGASGEAAAGGLVPASAVSTQP